VEVLFIINPGVVSTYFDPARAGLSTGAQPPYAGAMDSVFKWAFRASIAKTTDLRNSSPNWPKDSYSLFYQPKYLLLPASVAPALVSTGSTTAGWGFGIVITLGSRGFSPFYQPERLSHSGMGNAHLLGHSQQSYQPERLEHWWILCHAFSMDGKSGLWIFL